MYVVQLCARVRLLPFGPGGGEGGGLPNQVVVADGAPSISLLVHARCEAGRHGDTARVRHHDTFVVVLFAAKV